MPGPVQHQAWHPLRLSSPCVTGSYVYGLVSPPPKISPPIPVPFSAFIISLFAAEGILGSEDSQSYWGPCTFPP